MTGVKYRFEFQGVPEVSITTEGETYQECRDKATGQWLREHRNLPKLFGSFKLKG